MNEFLYGTRIAPARTGEPELHRNSLKAFHPTAFRRPLRKSCFIETSLTLQQVTNTLDDRPNRGDEK